MEVQSIDSRIRSLQSFRALRTTAENSSGLSPAFPVRPPFVERSARRKPGARQAGAGARAGQAGLLPAAAIARRAKANDREQKQAWPAADGKRGATS